jgi:hypothetical protein
MSFPAAGRYAVRLGLAFGPVAIGAEGGQSATA